MITPSRHTIKMKRIAYILISILCTLGVSAQCPIEIDTVSYRYYNGITEQEQIIDNYRIINHSDEEYLTWVSLIPANDKSNNELMHDFFKKRKGDFTLYQVMIEWLDMRDKGSNIGYSFIKVIPPNEEFTYVIATTDPASTFYQERIIAIRRNEVEEYLRLQIPESYFSPLSSIFLIEN